MEKCQMRTRTTARDFSHVIAQTKVPAVRFFISQRRDVTVSSRGKEGCLQGGVEDSNEVDASSLPERQHISGSLNEQSRS